MSPAFKTPSSVFGKRLREARLASGLPQDRLGVLSGLDETTASARISRYESGQHAPPYSFAERLAALLNVPVPYFYAVDDDLANWILAFARASANHRSRALRILSTAKPEAKVSKHSVTRERK
ncbi:MAG: helix-turn-helix domain-containing protein [Candidatus Accumulibacter sp.]|jgi:transcriptional regulator with XRE-family HTH domain|nr:helix-turn-helix domain-containing protein [Accumulibacter sp.]